MRDAMHWVALRRPIPPSGCIRDDRDQAASFQPWDVAATPLKSFCLVTTPQIFDSEVTALLPLNCFLHNKVWWPTCTMYPLGILLSFPEAPRFKLQQRLVHVLRPSPSTALRNQWVISKWISVKGSCSSASTMQARLKSASQRKRGSSHWHNLGSRPLTTANSFYAQLAISYSAVNITLSRSISFPVIASTRLTCRSMGYHSQLHCIPLPSYRQKHRDKVKFRGSRRRKWITAGWRFEAQLAALCRPERRQLCILLHREHPMLAES